MSVKPVEEIMRRIGERSKERAFPGGAIGKERGWRTDPFKVLISTVLSQRTRDDSTHQASERLFRYYNTPLSLSEAPLDKVDELIRPVGFHQAKAKAIREIARVIHQDYEDRVPADMDMLLALPMVGRKTANCVLSYAFKVDTICVDTHVHRVSNRIGLVHSKNPDGTEEQLKVIVPQPLWRLVNELLVRFGQEVCTPLRPKHDICPVREFCDHYQNILEHEAVT